jgi:hypothetical protein
MKKLLYPLCLLTAAALIFSCRENREIRHQFCHHVYFWLNNPDDPADREAFESAIADLLEIPEIKSYHLGIPVAATAGRGVVDASYTYSYMVFFDDLEGHDIYQDHPLHVKFVEENSHLWNRVVVYDSEVKK